MAGRLRRPKAAIPTGEGRNPGRAARSGPDPTPEGGARQLFSSAGRAVATVRVPVPRFRPFRPAFPVMPQAPVWAQGGVGWMSAFRLGSLISGR
ncbi:hypothetical protein GCM10010493_18350 [Streptomyces lavendulae subsp. grasserius]